MSNLRPVPQPNYVNGVDVDTLHGIVHAIQGNPEIAKFNFRAANVWAGGDHARTTIKTFTGACAEHTHRAGGYIVETSEPAVLLGRDVSPNPGEWLLHALISCITTTIVYHAAANGVEIAAISSELDGDIDLRGFLGLSKDVPKGYQSIRVNLRVKTTASRETIRAFAEMSSVLEMVSKAAPVAVNIVID